jgi:hypothetical protein
LPKDAQTDDPTNWMISGEITYKLQQIPSRHVLVVSDSCYAGGLVREAVLEREKRDRENFLRKMIQSPSRYLLASGGLSPVSDGGGNGHSIFASALLHHLGKQRDDAAFTATDLFQEVKLSVAGNSRQTPEFRQIQKGSREIGDVGDFVFLRQPAAGKVAVH